MTDAAYGMQEEIEAGNVVPPAPRLIGDQGEAHPAYAGFWGRTDFDHGLLAALPKVRRVAQMLTKRADLADDLVQDTCVQALKSWETFTPGTNMAAWLCFIARNRFYSDKRRDWRWSDLPDEFAVMIPCETNAHHRLELQDALGALSYLPIWASEIVLAAAEGLTIGELAAEFVVEEGTIKSRLHRARDMLTIYFSATDHVAAA